MPSETSFLPFPLRVLLDCKPACQLCRESWVFQTSGLAEHPATSVCQIPQGTSLAYYPLSQIERDVHADLGAGVEQGILSWILQKYLRSHMWRKNFETIQQILFMLTFGLSQPEYPRQRNRIFRDSEPLDLHKMHSGCFFVSAAINCILFLCIYIIYICISYRQ